MDLPVEDVAVQLSIANVARSSNQALMTDLEMDIVAGLVKSRYGWLTMHQLCVVIDSGICGDFEVDRGGFLAINSVTIFRWIETARERGLIPFRLNEAKEAARLSVEELVTRAWLSHMKVSDYLMKIYGCTIAEYQAERGGCQ